MTDLLLAHDIGTTGAKATIWSVQGELVASAFVPYATRFPAPGCAEQDPEDWWRAVCAGTREVLASLARPASDVAAVSFSAMMNGCVLIDDLGGVVRPAIIHADVRSREQCKRVAASVGARRVYQISGNQLSPHFTLAKAAWIADNEPAALASARWCVQAKDYIAGRLTGVHGITDPSDASLTGLLAMRSRTWSAELADAARLPVRLLPEIHPAGSLIGSVTTDAAAQTGLTQGTPVILGGGDGACATVGAGAVRPGDVYHYLGGSSWIAASSGEFKPDPQMRVSTFCGLAPGQYVTYGTVQSAGSSVEWFLNAIGAGLATEGRYEELVRLADSAPPGSRGLFYLPYLQGERAPIWDAHARGVYFGLSAAHTRAELARAVLEGVAYALGSILRVFEGQGLAPDQVRVLGGGMRNVAWRRIFAAVYGRPLAVMTRLSEATAAGEAVAAGIGVGLLDGWAAARDFAPITVVEHPDPAWRGDYARFSAFYETLYPVMAERFAALAHLTGDDAGRRP